MEYRRIGSTDLNVSRICFGCWAIGGHGYGYVDDDESIRTIKKALDNGINFFDTANVYGFGHSEEILGKALGNKKNDVVIASKFGVNWDENGKTYKECSPKIIIESLESSLNRLKIDCIPLFQLHWYDEKTPIDEIMDTLLKCKDAGKILEIGCCNLSEDVFRQWKSAVNFVTSQNLYNLVNRENGKMINLLSDKYKMGILAYSVMGRGIFSAKFDKNSKFENNDTRNADPDFSGDKFNKNMFIANNLKKIGEKYNKSAAQVAIRWVLENKNIACAIVGMKNIKQVTENIDTVGWSLNKEDLDLIDSII